ncbi:MAG: hypothetical protein J5897_07060 [Candidatus Methanomethylophilus sp.]|nr:hypothetical protein [Methanomethylophilus sp.]
MNQVQNGGVSSPAQEYIKNEEVQKRPISDQAFKFYSKDIEDDHFFRTMMAPGKFHYLYGNLGIGKTHFMMNMMYLLLQGYDGCGEWEVVTNVFMYHKDESGTEVCDPDHVHHIDSLDEFFDKIVELSDTGRRVALFLDDFNRFFFEEGKDPLSRYLRQMILNRRKLGVLLFFSSTEDIADFENDWAGRRYPADFLWTRYKSKKEWDQTRKDLELDIDWNRWDTTGCIVLGGDLAHIGSSLTEWTDSKKASGWFYDKVSDASVLRFRKGFDFDSFWRGLENVSSLSAKAYIRTYTSSMSEEKVREVEQCQQEKDVVEIAAKLKSMGLTDEAIECALNVPKTTLRRWVEKSGHQWKVGEIELPYRFKSLREKT